VYARRALLTIPSLRCGGAERVFTVVLNGLAARGFDMHVALCQKEGHWLERLSPQVTVHDLKAPRVRQSVFALARLCSRLLPRSVLSTSFHLNVLVGLLRPLLPSCTQVVLREVSINHFENSALKGLRGVLSHRAYQSADRVICLTDSMRKQVISRLGVKADRAVRIFNPLDDVADAALRTPPATSTEARRIVAIGSLRHYKGFDRIIAAMPRLLQKHPGSTLTIYGEGEHRADLEAQVAASDCAELIRLPGFTSDVRGALQSADLFVLSSRFEGMPNVLLDATLARCPYVVVDHPGGTRDVVELLGQQHRITSLLEDWKPEWFDPLPAGTIEQARRHFGLEAVLDEYASVLFPEVVSARRVA